MLMCVITFVSSLLPSGHVLSPRLPSWMLPMTYFNILSLQTKRFLGFVDMLDIVGFVVSMWDDNIMSDPALAYSKSMSLLSHAVKDCIGARPKLFL